jgi:hypothetical protein
MIVVYKIAKISKSFTITSDFKEISAKKFNYETYKQYNPAGYN